MVNNKWYRGTVFSLALLTGTATTQSATAATMIATQDALSLERAKVDDFLQREDVQNTLEQLGVDKEEARQRVAALAPDELRQVAERVDELPAAGDPIVISTGTVLLILILWLIFR